MNKAEQTRLTAWRLKILRCSQEEPRQVARTCRHFGISRTVLYRWKRRFAELGEAGLADRPDPREARHEPAAGKSEVPTASEAVETVREAAAGPPLADGCEVPRTHPGDGQAALSVLRSTIARAFAC